MRNGFIFVAVLTIIFLLATAGSDIAGEKYISSQNWPVYALRVLQAPLLSDFSNTKYKIVCMGVSDENAIKLKLNNIGSACFWLKKNQDGQTLTHFSVFFNSPEIPLNDLVKEYGKPDLVTWSDAAYYRYIGWAESGIIVLVNYHRVYVSGLNPRASLIIFTQPMPKEQFLAEAWDWPWDLFDPSMLKQNKYIEGFTDLIDSFPQDPFNWEELQK